MSEWKEPTHKEPIEGIKCGYCLDIQVNTEITLPRGNYDDSPQAPPSG